MSVFTFFSQTILKSQNSDGATSASILTSHIEFEIIGANFYPSIRLMDANFEYQYYFPKNTTVELYDFPHKQRVVWALTQDQPTMNKR